MNRLIMTILFVLLPLVTAKSSTQIRDLSPGQRIRIDYDSTYYKPFLLLRLKEVKQKAVRGDFISITHDSIMFKKDYGKLPISSIAISDIRKVYLSIGQKRATLNGLLWGAGFSSILLGIAAIAIISPGKKTYYEDPEGYPVYPGEIKWEKVALFISGFTILGAIIGYFTKIDRWQKVDLDNIRLETKFDPGDNRIQLDLVYSF